MTRDAYESDTGERDTPTCQNFLTKTSVQKVIVLSRGPRKALNRKCRAIARIMFSHGWNTQALSRIFGVSWKTMHRCTEDPTYHTRDEVENDYDYAGPEFREHFAPIEDDLEAESEDELQTNDSRKRKTRPTSGRQHPAKKPRLKSLVSSSPGSESSTPEVSEISPSSPIPSAHLHSSPSLDPQSTHSSLSRIVSSPSVELPQPAKPSTGRLISLAAVRLPHLSRAMPSPVLSTTMQRARWRESESSSLDRTSPHTNSEPSSPIPGRIISLPLVQSAHSVNATLPSALAEADVQQLLWATLPRQAALRLTSSAHLALFAARGFTVDRLQAMAQWSESEVSEAFHRLLLAKCTGGHIVLDAVELEILKTAVTIRKLQIRQKNTKSFPSAPLAHITHTALNLAAFLTNSVTLEWLRVLSSLPSSAAVELYGILARSLQKGSPLLANACGADSDAGMSPLEIIALEFSLREV
ncbi:hypothetical protein C8F01DRAFT_1312119 [Mycena amicta]|nr:hypothetical protein C8F01DRAFT_1312119 [Mycena amicta]